MRWLALVLVFVPLSLQGQETANLLLNYAEIPPSPWHEEQYASVERCAQITGDIRRVHWFVADMILNFRNPGQTVDEALKDFRPGDRKGGLWAPLGDTGESVIVLDRMRLYHTKIVRHEVVHDLLWGGDHDNPLFAKCSEPGG